VHDAIFTGGRTAGYFGYFASSSRHRYRLDRVINNVPRLFSCSSGTRYASGQISRRECKVSALSGNYRDNKYAKSSRFIDMPCHIDSRLECFEIISFRKVVNSNFTLNTGSLMLKVIAIMCSALRYISIFNFNILSTSVSLWKSQTECSIICELLLRWNQNNQRTSLLFIITAMSHVCIQILYVYKYWKYFAIGFQFQSVIARSRE